MVFDKEQSVSVPLPLPENIAVTFTFDLLTSKSIGFIFVSNCNQVVNFVEVPQAVVLTNFITHGRKPVSYTHLTLPTKRIV